MSTQQYYLVIVNYQTSQNGNDGTARIRVKADNEAHAIELATKKASSYTRVGKVVGGHVDGSPAPTDWGKEFRNVCKLRDKAMRYIAQMVDKHGPIELLNAIADRSGTSWGEDAAALIYPDTDGLYIHEDDSPEKDQMLEHFEDSSVIEIAAEVQKAIAGGTGK